MKNVYLLEDAKIYDLEKNPGYYNEKRKMNIIIKNGKEIPLISSDVKLSTNSKTLKAPSDDDPDPEAESCY